MSKFKLSICTISTLLLFLLSSCGNRTNTATLHNSNTSTADPISTTDTTQSISNDFIIQTVSNFYSEYYRKYNMNANDSETIHEGEKIKFNIYSAPQNYFLVTLDVNEEGDIYKNTLFKLNYDLSLSHEPNNSKLEEITLQEDLPFLCSGDFFVEAKENIKFSNFDEKEAKLQEITQLIWYRYFDYSDSKPQYDYAIFHESTQATKVQLLDFDEISTSYILYVYTADHSVYQVELKYDEKEKAYNFYEFTELCFLDSQIEAYNKDKEQQSIFSDFMNLYLFAQKHIIAEIDASSK